MTTAIATPLPATRAEWLAQRRTGIGGSDVAPILGLSPWRTPYEVWEDKTGRGEDQPDSPALYWGRLLEDPIRQAYADRTGLTVTKPDCMYSSVTHPFMHANLDGIASDGSLVEFKTTSRVDGWGEEGSDEIPEYYQTQVQHYMAVMGAEQTDIGVLIAGRDFRIYTVPADKELQEMLIDQEARFWSLVKADTPPEVSTSEDASRRWRFASAKKTVAADAQMIEAWQHLCSIRSQIDNLRTEEDELKALLMNGMQDAVSLKSNGKTLASWSLPSTRTTVDSKKLKQDFPAVWEQVAKTSAPQRTFRIYAPKE